MKRLFDKVRNISPEEANHLLTIFLASVLGSLGTTAFLNWIAAEVSSMEWAGQLLLSLVGTVLYGLIVGLTFYIFSPQSRPALKRLVTRQDD